MARYIYLSVCLCHLFRWNKLNRNESLGNQIKKEKQWQVRWLLAFISNRVESLMIDYFRLEEWHDFFFLDSLRMIDRISVVGASFPVMIKQFPLVQLRWKNHSACFPRSSRTNGCINELENWKIVNHPTREKWALLHEQILSVFFHRSECNWK